MWRFLQQKCGGGDKAKAVCTPYHRGRSRVFFSVRGIFRRCGVRTHAPNQLPKSSRNGGACHDTARKLLCTSSVAFVLDIKGVGVSLERCFAHSRWTSSIDGWLPPLIPQKSRFFLQVWVAIFLSLFLPEFPMRRLLVRWHSHCSYCVPWHAGLCLCGVRGED